MNPNQDEINCKIILHIGYDPLQRMMRQFL